MRQIKKFSGDPWDKEDKVFAASIVLLLGYVLAVCYHFLFGPLAAHQYPFNTFLFRPWARFSDFFDVYSMVSTHSPYIGEGLRMKNPPFFTLLASFFTLFSPRTGFIVLYALFVTAFLSFAYSELYHDSIIRTSCAVAVFSFCSYPFLFVVDRGNLEMLVFIFLFLSVFFYRRGHFYLASVFLAFAASKIFALVFLLLFLSDKRYKPLFFCVFLVLLSHAVSLIFLEGGMLGNIKAMIGNQEQYVLHYVIGDEGLYCGNSLFGMGKYMLYGLGLAFPGDKTSYVFLWYRLCCFIAVLLFVLGGYHVVFREKVLWRKVAVLVFFMDLLPLVSGDYKLLHLFIPLYLFINSEESYWNSLFYTLMFGLLLVPKAYIHLNVLAEASSTVLLNPLLMLAGFFGIVCPWPRKSPSSGSNLS